MPKLKSNKSSIREYGEYAEKARNPDYDPTTEYTDEQIAEFKENDQKLKDFGKKLIDEYEIDKVANFAKSAVSALQQNPWTKALQETQSDLAQAIQSVQMPQIPTIADYLQPMEFEMPDLSHLEEQRARESYLRELQIAALEKDMEERNLIPKYHFDTGIIDFMGEEIEIPLDTNQEMICRVVLKNNNSMRRKWSWDEILEAHREDIYKAFKQKAYRAAREINVKVAAKTAYPDFFIIKPMGTVTLNPKLLE